MNDIVIKTDRASKLLIGFKSLEIEFEPTAPGPIDISSQLSRRLPRPRPLPLDDPRPVPEPEDLGVAQETAVFRPGSDAPIEIEHGVGGTASLRYMVTMDDLEIRGPWRCRMTNRTAITAHARLAVSYPTADHTLSDLMRRFSGYDHNDDGVPSIHSLVFADFETDPDALTRESPLVLILVEPRVITSLEEADSLWPRIQRHRDDLVAEGFVPRVICADVYRGPRHQDGRTLLALRDLLRAVHLRYPGLCGVILVGSFPEATIVRRWIWPRYWDDKIVINGVMFTGPRKWLSLGPEMTARSEIVLADLTGNWQHLYREAPQAIESITAMPAPDSPWPEDVAAPWPFEASATSPTFEMTSAVFDVSSTTFRDFFFVQDDDYTILEQSPDRLRLRLSLAMRHPEISRGDRDRPNAIARPDIYVSRIDARHVAINPDPRIVGSDGRGLLDDHGLPRAMSSTQQLFTHDIAPPAELDPPVMVHDPLLERRLLIDYFDRNHRFRKRALAGSPTRAAMIMDPDFNMADTYVTNTAPELAPVVRGPDKPTLLDYAKWLQQPAALRVIRAHSGKWWSEFGSGDDYRAEDLEIATGGRPFRWIWDRQTYTPSFSGQRNHADLLLYRTMWNSHVIDPESGSLIIHGGSDTNEPHGTQTFSYGDVDYGWANNAESILFYTDGLALVARSKSFNDFPDLPVDFTVRPFGDVLHSYFETQSADAPASARPTSCKQAYRWSTIGDWTLRIRR